LAVPITRLPFLLSTAAIAVAALQTPATPAQYRSGPLPPIPTHAVGGGEVLLEVLVGYTGSVRAVTALRSTPPFTELMTTAVQAWRFVPASRQGPIESSVLVAAVFRPPTVAAPTLGTGSTNVVAPGREIPFPTRMVTPPYPALAIDNRAVLVEARIGPSGNVTEAKVAGSASGFDDAALQAAREWIFRPGESDGAPVQALVYIVFGFRQPVTSHQMRVRSPGFK
jgi:TonB family protein